MNKFEFRGNVLVGMGRIGWRDLRLEKGALLGDNSSCSSARSYFKRGAQKWSNQRERESKEGQYTTHIKTI